MNSIGRKIIKIFSLIMLIFLILMISVSYLLFNNEFSNIKKDILKDSKKISQKIDAKKMEAVLNTKTQNSREYEELLNDTLEYKGYYNLKYLYTLYKVNNKYAAFAVDADLKLERQKIGARYPMEKEMLEAFRGKTTVNESETLDITTGKYVISAYSPIRDKNKKVIAIVGADFDVTQFKVLREGLIKSIIILSFFITILTLAIIIVFSRSISKKINNIIKFADKLGIGDIRYDIPIEKDEKDDISKATISLSKAGSNLNALISEVANISGKVENHSKELYNLTEEFVDSYEEVGNSANYVLRSINIQNNNLENMKESIGEFGKYIEKITKYVDDVAGNANNINYMVIEKGEDFNKLIKTSKGVQRAFDNANKAINNLVVRIRKIEEISLMINAISEQTHLLSLNASIEAAKSYDSKGFNIIANEIRRLSEKCKNYSNEINRLTFEIFNDKNIVGENLKLTIESMNLQHEVIKQAMISSKNIINEINDIVPRIENVNDDIKIINVEKDRIVSKINSIAYAATEISSASGQIFVSIKDVTDYTQNLLKYSDELYSISKNLLDNIHKFKI